MKHPTQRIRTPSAIAKPDQRSPRPLGRWFVWNVLYTDDEGNNDFERNQLYFLPFD